MRRSSSKALAAVAALAVFGGCYGAKLVKGPVNSEYAARQADSLRAENARLLQQLAALESRVDEEREARLRNQAQTSATLSEMEESLRILVSRFDDLGQLSPGARQDRRRVSRPVVTPRDTASADSGIVDSLAARRLGLGGDADELYRSAYLDLTRGNHDLAIQGFQTYLVRHPTGPHLPEVHYYLGECFYAGDRFLEAVGEFRYLVENFPASRLVPAAYLKTGRCYQSLEEKNLAVRAYRTLIDRHPDTEEAQQARDALAELEG